MVASIHWGRNDGCGRDSRNVVFARRLIDDAGVDVVHGHSSHHVKRIERHRGKPILHGCGDFINDYEEIPRSPRQLSFVPDLGLVCFARLSLANGSLVALEMWPARR